MAAKRDIDSVTAASSWESSSPTNKRPRSTTNGQSQGQGQRKKTSKQQQQSEGLTDVTYGQRCCFPGLNNDPRSHGDSDEDLDFEDETDALAYLQSVRQQASGIPHLLVAPRSGPQLPPTTDEPEYKYDDDDDDDDDADGRHMDRSIYSDGRGDTRGYYRDGAYTAAPDARLDEEDCYDQDDWDEGCDEYEHGVDDDDGEDDIEAAYFSSLATRFLSLREHLHRTPPPEALASLTRDQSPHVGAFGPRSRTFSVWSARLLHSDPHPAQVAAMDKAGALRVLRVLLGDRRFLSGGAEVRERTSRWLWALLARLPDRGEMDHTDVGHVRELGKRAALLMHTLKEMAALREEVELGIHGGDGVDAEEWMMCGQDDEDDDEDGRREGEAKAEAHADAEGDGVSFSVQPAPCLIADPASPPNAPTGRSVAKQGEDERKDEEGEEVEEGEVQDESVPMDLSDEEQQQQHDVESARARLLAQLDSATGATETEDVPKNHQRRGEGEEERQEEEEDEEEAVAYDALRARINMRATLNMILTVAGEFYGQRDLLEFRDPFHGI